jgi:signal transduction histidine kinase
LISENANNTLNLLENLLVWARSQTGRIAFQPVKQRLISILQSVEETLKQAINQKNLGFEIFISDDIEVLADTNMLVSIFQNLISNAIKYSRPGGFIRVNAQETENQVEIIVSDNGLGMSKDTMSKLFKVGEDISIPGTRNEKGSGLGLIICKDFVERHQGNILVESELGKGSEFTIRLPKF